MSQRMETLQRMALPALIRLLSSDEIQAVISREQASDELRSAARLANAVALLEDITRPVIMCTCADFMTCEHPYPERLRLL